MTSLKSFLLDFECSYKSAGIEYTVLLDMFSQNLKRTIKSPVSLSSDIMLSNQFSENLKVLGGGSCYILTYNESAIKSHSVQQILMANSNNTVLHFEVQGSK